MCCVEAVLKIGIIGERGMIRNVFPKAELSSTLHVISCSLNKRRSDQGAFPEHG